MTNDELITENINLAYKLANRYYKMFGGAIELEELYSLSFLGLTKAARSFDPKKNIAFSTFAYTCIKNEILFFYRLNKKHTKLSIDNEVIDNKIFEEIMSDDINVENDVLGKLEVIELYKYIYTLPEIERDILLYYLQGKKMTEIAKILGYTQSNISRLYHRALNRLRNKFGD